MIQFLKHHPEVIPLVILVILLAGIMPHIHSAAELYWGELQSFDPGIRIDRLVIR